jgi:hypothetical protein
MSRRRSPKASVWRALRNARRGCNKGYQANHRADCADHAGLGYGVQIIRGHRSLAPTGWEASASCIRRYHSASQYSWADSGTPRVQVERTEIAMLPSITSSLPIGDRGDRYAGGGSGIRTHGGLAPTPVFKTGALNRSAIPPASRSMREDACFFKARVFAGAGKVGVCRSGRIFNRPSAEQCIGLPHAAMPHSRPFPDIIG